MLFGRAHRLRVSRQKHRCRLRQGHSVGDDAFQLSLFYCLSPTEFWESRQKGAL